MFCGKCGNKVKDTDKYCGNCGNNIATQKEENKAALINVLKTTALIIIMILAIITLVVISSWKILIKKFH